MYENAQYMNGSMGTLSCIRCDINGTTIFVPIDPANADYQNIMKLVENGELTIAPAEVS